MASNVVAERDEFVSCPGCDRTIAKLARDLLKGDRIRASDFIAVNGSPAIVPNMLAKCPDCGDIWFDGRRLHIDGRGWT